jgi:hypothetical protein
LKDLLHGITSNSAEPYVLEHHSVLERWGTRCESISMSTIKSLSSSRVFKVWEYQVSHGHLLIRSPQAPAIRSEPEQVTNLDIHFLGVDYFELPRVLKGVEIVTPMEAEMERIGSILGTQLAPDRLVVLLSENDRFFVVAEGFTITENRWDIFESPIEFRSHFRAK